MYLSRGGCYHKSPNDATLQLYTPKRELEQFFHPPVLAANYINLKKLNYPEFNGFFEYVID